MKEDLVVVESNNFNIGDILPNGDIIEDKYYDELEETNVYTVVDKDDFIKNITDIDIKNLDY